MRIPASHRAAVLLVAVLLVVELLAVVLLVVELLAVVLLVVVAVPLAELPAILPAARVLKVAVRTPVLRVIQATLTSRR